MSTKLAFLFLAVFYALFLLSLPLGKPSYEEALFAYLVMSPFIYSLYLDLYAMKTSKKGLSAYFAVYLTLLVLLPWLVGIVATRDWMKTLKGFLEINFAGLVRYFYYLSGPSPSPPFDRVRVVRTLYPLLPLHASYAVVALSIVLSAGLDRRLLLWYFAIYPAALAAAVAGGGRPATLAAAAIYLAAYALGTERLLLLLVAIPIARHLGLHKLLQSLRSA